MMNFNSIKDIVDFIKVIQSIEYVIKKIKDFKDWSKNNIDTLNYYFYSKAVKWTIAIVFILLFTTNIAYCIICIVSSIYENNLSFNSLILKILITPLLMTIIALFLLKSFFDYEKDRVTHLRKKHTLNLV